MPSPKIFVINLDRRPDRLESILNTLEALGLEWERVPAVDGNDPVMDAEVDWEKFHPYNQYLAVRRGPLGCYMSHRKIWKTIVDRNLPQALILEDDVTPLPNWDPEILNVDLAALGLDSLRLDCSRKMGRLPWYKFKSMCVGKWRATNRNSWGAGAYLITAEGARKKLRLEKMWFMADDYLMFSDVCGVKSALLKPQMWDHAEASPSDNAPPRNFWKGTSLFGKLVAYVITRQNRRREKGRLRTNNSGCCPNAAIADHT